MPAASAATSASRVMFWQPIPSTAAIMSVPGATLYLWPPVSTHRLPHVGDDVLLSEDCTRRGRLRTSGHAADLAVPGRRVARQVDRLPRSVGRVAGGGRRRRCRTQVGRDRSRGRNSPPSVTRTRRLRPVFDDLVGTAARGVRGAELLRIAGAAIEHHQAHEIVGRRSRRQRSPSSACRKSIRDLRSCVMPASSRRMVSCASRLVHGDDRDRTTRPTRARTSWRSRCRRPARWLRACCRAARCTSPAVRAAIAFQSAPGTASLSSAIARFASSSASPSTLRIAIGRSALHVRAQLVVRDRVGAALCELAPRAIEVAPDLRIRVVDFVNGAPAIGRRGCVDIRRGARRGRSYRPAPRRSGSRRPHGRARRATGHCRGTYFQCFGSSVTWQAGFEPRQSTCRPCTGDGGRLGRSGARHLTALQSVGCGREDLRELGLCHHVLARCGLAALVLRCARDHAIGVTRALATDRHRFGRFRLALYRGCRREQTASQCTHGVIVTTSAAAVLAALAALERGERF